VGQHQENARTSSYCFDYLQKIKKKNTSLLFDAKDAS
jgi:hypothetical protein